MAVQRRIKEVISTSIQSAQTNFAIEKRRQGFFRAHRWVEKTGLRTDGVYAFRGAQIHASFGAGLGEERPSFQYNLASVILVHPRWYPSLEFNGRSLRGKNALYLTPGVYRRIGRQFEFGFGTPIGLTENWGSAGIVAKLTLEIGR